MMKEYISSSHRIFPVLHKEDHSSMEPSERELNTLCAFTMPFFLSRNDSKIWKIRVNKRSKYEKTLTLGYKLWIVRQGRVCTVSNQLSTYGLRVGRHNRATDHNVLPIHSTIIDLSKNSIQLHMEYHQKTTTIISANEIEVA